MQHPGFPCAKPPAGTNTAAPTVAELKARCRSVGRPCPVSGRGEQCSIPNTEVPRLLTAEELLGQPPPLLAWSFPMRTPDYEIPQVILPVYLKSAHNFNAIISGLGMPDLQQNVAVYKLASQDLCFCFGTPAGQLRPSSKIFSSTVHVLCRSPSTLASHGF